MLSPNVLLLASHTRRLFVFGYEADDVEAVDQHSKRFPIYSAVKLPLEKERDFVEVVYDLDVVFDGASYPNSKKRHQRIKYPFTWAANHGLEICDCYTDSLLKVYEEWVRYKRADPKVYQIMFPDARYRRCINDAHNNPLDLDYKIYTIYYQNALVGGRVIQIDSQRAYDLAFFTLFWKIPSQVVEYANAMVMNKLRAIGVKFFNCGAASSSKLEVFKTHYPHSKVMSMAYPVQVIEKTENTKQKQKQKLF